MMEKRWVQKSFLSLNSVMKSIKRLVIKGFRGIRNELILEPNGKSLLLLAENSRGKSSITDAIEWFLSPKHEIERLSSEGSGCADYPHLGVSAEGGESLVSIEFLGVPRPLQKQFDPKKISQPQLSDQKEFEALCTSYVVNPWLRYWDVASFVLESKAKKYEILAGWMGFEELLSEQLLLRDAQETVRSYIIDIEREIAALKSTLKQLTGASRLTDKMLVDFCNARLAELNKKDSVDSLQSLNALLEKMHAEQLTERAVRATKLKELDGVLANTTYAVFNEANLQCINDGISFMTDDAAVREAKTESLYQAGMSILTGNESVSECPLCNTPWQTTSVGSKEALMQHIQTELNSLSESKKKAAGLKEAAASLQNTVLGEIRTVEGLWVHIQQGLETLGYCPIYILRTIDGYLESLRSLRTHLANQQWSDAKKVDISASQQRFKEELSTFRTLLAEEEYRISLSETEAKLSEQVAFLVTIADKWGQLVHTEEKKAYMEQESEKFFTICSAISGKLESSVQQRFDDIATLVQKYFEKLRPSARPQNGITQISLELQHGRAAGRSAEVEFNFHTIKGMSPPKRVMTESHLNALGIAIYFALSKRLNPDTKFLLLDDVINSFDSEHRYHFAQLLAEEFNDFQLFILTHDDLTYGEMRQLMPSALPKQIVSWHFDHGVELADYSTHLHNCDNFCATGQPIEAGKALGAHVDRELNILCERLCAKTAHQYTTRRGQHAQELWNALYAVLKNEMKCEDVFLKRIISAKVVSFIRNFCSHDQQSYPSSVSTDEIISIKEEWEKVSAEFKCTECRTLVTRLPVQKFAQCRCRRLQIPSVPVESEETSEEQAVVSAVTS